MLIFYLKCKSLPFCLLTPKLWTIVNTENRIHEVHVRLSSCRHVAARCRAITTHAPRLHFPLRIQQEQTVPHMNHIINKCAWALVSSSYRHVCMSGSAQVSSYWTRVCFSPNGTLVIGSLHVGVPRSLHRGFNQRKHWEYKNTHLARRILRSVPVPEFNAKSASCSNGEHGKLQQE